MVATVTALQAQCCSLVPSMTNRDGYSVTRKKKKLTGFLPSVKMLYVHGNMSVCFIRGSLEVGTHRFVEFKFDVTRDSNATSYCKKREREIQKMFQLLVNITWTWTFMTWLL